MTNRDIYDAALSLLAEEQCEDCGDYEARAPHILACFVNECRQCDGYYRSARGMSEGEMAVGAPVDLDDSFALHERFAAAGAFYLAALLVEMENGSFSDRLFSKYAEEIKRITGEGCSGVSVSIRDVYGFD